MAWLRIDDSSVINSKLGRLTDREYRALAALWSYCARAGNGGRFTLSDLDFCIYFSTKNSEKRTTKQQKTLTKELKTFIETGLIDVVDEVGDTFQVHDWHEYQPQDPTAAERMRRYRKKQQEGGDEP